MKLFSYDAAKTALEKGYSVEMVDRDATGQHHTSTHVWLEDGEIIRSHPTDPNGLDVRIPTDWRRWRTTGKVAEPGDLIERCQSNHSGHSTVAQPDPRVVETRTADEIEVLPELADPFFWRVTKAHDE